LAIVGIVRTPFVNIVFIDYVLASN